MAPRFLRRRRGGSEPPATEGMPVEAEHLDGEAHAWWAQRELDAPWAPHAEPEPAPRRPPPDDLLAEHFGPEWRTSFDPRPPEPPPLVDEAVAPPSTSADPYEVLEMPATATWDEIVAAHRRLARRHHPDRVAAGSADQQAAAEGWIRAVNAAYEELKVRRGR